MNAMAHPNPPEVRHPAVAGQFYPIQTDRLTDMANRFLRQAVPTQGSPKAVIAPHAGYMYSGPIAGSALAPLQDRADTLRRIVLIGPSHRVPFEGIACCSQPYATPLGVVPLDMEAMADLAKLPFVQMYNEAHALEHSLEVELPFLQLILKNFSLVPLVVGNANPGDVATALEWVWGGPETAIVVSSDLSHYLTYHAAQKLDQRTAQAIEQLDGPSIHEDQACGRLPIRGLLMMAEKKGLQARTVDLRNSGDTAGSKDRVVGYGAFVFDAPVSA